MGNGVVVAGQRSTAIITQVDGVSFNDPLQGGRRGAGDGTFFLPQTVVREFQIVRSGVTAEVGGTNAGLINVATKEGSNRFRGEAFFTAGPDGRLRDAFGHHWTTGRPPLAGLSADRSGTTQLFYYAGFEQDFLHGPYYLQFEPQARHDVPAAAIAGLQDRSSNAISPRRVFARIDAAAQRGEYIESAARRQSRSRLQYRRWLDAQHHHARLRFTRSADKASGAKSV